jgi:ketosteroid isomerase-like protein
VNAVEVVHEAFDVLRESGPAGLVERYDDFLTADLEWHPVLIGTLEGRSYRGREGFERYWGDFGEGFKNLRWSDPSYEEVGPDLVLVSSHISGEGTGSGIPLEMDPAYVFEIRDGRISLARSFFSRADAEEFLAHA